MFSHGILLHDLNEIILTIKDKSVKCSCSFDDFIISSKFWFETQNKFNVLTPAMITVKPF